MTTHDTSSRRNFLKGSLGAVGGLTALGAALAPLKDYDGSALSLERILQKHYKEMTPEEKEVVLERIRQEVQERYDVRPEIKDYQPLDGVEYAYALNLGRCIGCRKCVHACVAENNQSRDPEIQYIRVLKMPRGTIDPEHSDHHYDARRVPEKDSFYMPVQCHQCAKAPCVAVCPVEATWKEKDGIVVIDSEWCIGCRYCMAACPYWSRRFNFAEPKIPKEELNPDMGYLSNRPRPKGVVEKCHFCLHRTRQGKYPACLEVCPVGARKFGNINDPNSEVSHIYKTKRVYKLKEEANTGPRFFYYFDDEYPQQPR